MSREGEYVWVYMYILSNNSINNTTVLIERELQLLAGLLCARGGCCCPHQACAHTQLTWLSITNCTKRPAPAPPGTTC